jgi:hypothetical protein
MHWRPSHHAEDIGARLAEPSSFKVLISTTGVPKYKIAGSIVRTIENLSDRCSNFPFSKTIEKRGQWKYPHLALKLKKVGNGTHQG